MEDQDGIAGGGSLLGRLLEEGPMQAAVACAVRDRGGGEAEIDLALSVVRLMRQDLEGSTSALRRRLGSRGAMIVSEAVFEWAKSRQRAGDPEF